MSPEVTATAPSSVLRRSASRPLHFELSARARRYIRLLLSIGEAEDIILDGGTGLGCLSPAQKKWPPEGAPPEGIRRRSAGASKPNVTFGVHFFHNTEA